LGLPPRVAMAGLHVLAAGSHGRWGVAVVATARRGRDREKRAQWRLVLGVALASMLVIAFGGVALRRQRRQLEIARELAVAEIQHERDERLLRADKLATMGALATGIAHEISTPLSVIMGRAEQLLPQLSGDERATRALDVILAETERIGHVIRGFLGLARGRAPSFERVAPSVLGRHAVELVEHRFDAAGVRLSYDAAPRLPLVACEPRLFEQILVNLLLNACDACERGGNVDLSVRADAERVAFLVVDDGVGIAPEDAARVTEPFFTTKPTGTGLGLAIANELVKHHQGTLTIRSRSAPTDSAPESGAVRGTRVCVEVPSSSEVRNE
jgi:signal transduction histidine kinase